MLARFATLCLFLLVSRCVPAQQTAQAESSAAERPNIVVLYTDDQAFLTTQVTGNAQVQTPHMDALAAEGVLFTHHYNSTAICMGSRASLMTGMYEYKTGCNFSHGPMRPKTFAKSYPVLLRNNGYRTGFAGKFGFAVTNGKSESDRSYQVLPVDQFDSWGGGVGQTNYKTAANKYIAKYADKYPHSSRAYGAFAQDFIRESVDDKRPFCLTLFFKAPHRPFTPDPFFDSVYQDVAFKQPANYGPKHGSHLAKQSRLGRQNLSFFYDMGFDPQHYQDTMRRYHQLIHGVDYAVGMLREELAKQGLAENTIIILTSDNGFFCGSHGFGGKVLPYQEGSHVPLIILDPRKGANGQRYQHVTGTVDVAPTVLDYAGVKTPSVMDGVSLVDAVCDPAATVARQTIPLFQVWGSPLTYSMSVVDQRYKYIYWCCGEQLEPAEELFDLQNDPHEMTNLVDDDQHQAILETMRQRYASQLKHWQQNAVSDRNYPSFGTLLDPNVPWAQKSDLVSPAQWKSYLSLVKALGVKQEDAFNYNKVLKAAH
ncbi:Arylsulfatase [Stieleria bergensis]|uniref:Arylsulfatase n=1 Tax=Stieleria bergensis TaxID=2528025 RepID=A0A517SRW7_9BACT|nr:Arylsulfatase [Planctomycetes bacterium SV_7m_r]